MRGPKLALLCLMLLFAPPVSAATIIDLGNLGLASGNVSYAEAASYDDGDLQFTRFLFLVGGPGTRSVSLGYRQETRSPRVETCPDPADPDSCFVEPDGNYQDHAGVDLRTFTLGLQGQAGSTVALPTGFVDAVTGGPGAGIPSFGFDTIVYSFDLSREFALPGDGSYFADIAGFGIISGPDFPSAGGGQVAYTFSFQPRGAIPEPPIWATLVLAFGLVGHCLRRHTGRPDEKRRQRLPAALRSC